MTQEKFIERTDRDLNYENQLMWFVMGAVFLYRRRGDMSINDEQHHGHYARVYSTVLRYLSNTKTLDGSCSDFECALALEAAKVFGRTNERVEGFTY